jgi:hypothetical protein
MPLTDLLEKDFLYVGSWNSSHSRPHHVVWLKDKPGIYAFVIGDDVVYVGSTAFLRRRLKEYSRRAFQKGKQEQDAIYDRILASVLDSSEIFVFAKPLHPASLTELDRIAGELIAEINPVWNDASG